MSLVPFCLTFYRTKLSFLLSQYYSCIFVLVTSPVNVIIKIYFQSLSISWVILGYLFNIKLYIETKQNLFFLYICILYEIVWFSVKEVKCFVVDNKRDTSFVKATYEGCAN